MTRTVSQTQANGRAVLLTILAVPVVVLLLSTALYYLVDSKAIDLGTVNNGTLVVPPLRFSELALTKQDGSPYHYGEPTPLWSLVVFDSGKCLSDCERMLYLSRQSHIALAKKMPRVQRLYVSTQAPTNATQQLLAAQYKDTQVLQTTPQALQNLFAGSPVEPMAERRFFVVDHHGWLMMYYDAPNTEQST